MATQYEPIVKDATLNTTEQTPRNIADVLADELVISDLVTQATAIVTKLQALINAVKPNASDIPLDPITGMSANNVQLGISELKGTLNGKATVIDVGAISGSDNKTIIINVFNAINIFDVPVLVKFDNSGKGIGLAYKYSGGEHGMMVCMRYGFPNVFTLRRMSNADTVIYFTGTSY